MNKIIESCTFVAENSKHVKVDFAKVDEFCDYFNHSHINHWINESPFNFDSLGAKDKLHFLLVFNAISFSYWGEPKWNIMYHGNEVDGAYGMISAIARAVEDGVQILNPSFLADISEDSLAHILEGNTEIPLFKERLNILREVGQVLSQNFNGNFQNVIQKAGGECQQLLDLLITVFPSFLDISHYEGKEIYFYKRAQLLIADIAQAFSDDQYIDVKHTQELTACADYKLPFVLRRLGVFIYSAPLSEKIDNNIPIEKDSIEEVELRANTICVVEYMKNVIRKKISSVQSIHINDHLWMLGQEKYEDDKPYHHTRTTAY